MHPDVPPAVNAVMQDLATGLHRVLGGRLVGLYLGGSVASGDYAEATSDLDFLAVTRGALSPEDKLSVALLHRELKSRHRVASRLQGDYAPLDTLVPEGTSAPVPGCEHGVFLPRVGEIMLSADNIADMAINSRTFFGPPAREVLPQVTPDHVRDAVRTLLKDGAGACSTPTEYAAEVLNLVRSLCALESGQPTTKSAGARWALQNLASRWHPVVRAAVAVRSGKGTPEDEALIAAELLSMEASLRPE